MSMAAAAADVVVAFATFDSYPINKYLNLQTSKKKLLVH